MFCVPITLASSFRAEWLDEGENDMERDVVRAALLQTDWAGTKEAMIDKHEAAVHEAAKQGAQVMCFQELFYGPYFCQVQESEYYGYTEYIPDGPTTQRFQSIAKETGMVLVLPMYEIEQPGIYYNTAAVIDADGTYLGKYRKQHIPQVKGFWEKFYFKPGNGGYPVFDTAVGKVGVYICYDRHFPEGWRALGLNGAKIVFNPSATHRGLSEYIWRVEQPAAAVANITENCFVITAPINKHQNKKPKPRAYVILVIPEKEDLLEVIPPVKDV